MLRSARNFWIEAGIDGRRSILGGGPRGKDGGFEMTIFQRANGAVMRPVRIVGWAEPDGTIGLTMHCPDGETRKHITAR